MRQLDRMRMGVALAGLLLCMTSSALAMSGGRQTAAEEPDTLAKVCNVNLDDDGSLQWFAKATDAVPSVVLRNHDGTEFQTLCTAISESQAVANGHGSPVQSLVFYERTGQVDRQLYVTDSGLLLDSATNRYFQPNDTVLAFLKAHTATS